MYFVQMLLDENSAIRAKIPPIFLNLMGPTLQKVDLAIRPGLLSLTWTSLNLDVYFSNIKIALDQLDLLIKKVIFLYHHT